MERTRPLDIYKAEKGLSVRSSNVDLAGSGNIFGTIGSNALLMNLATSAGFLPIDGKGGTINLTGDDNVDPKWLGLSSRNMQYWAYNYCSPLAAVIDRLAEADTNGRIEVVNDDMTVVNYRKNPVLNRVMKLMVNPNPFQTREEFNAEQIVLCKIFGFCPVFCVSPLGMDKTYTRYMFNLNPFYCIPQLNYDYSMYNPTVGMIKNWNITILGETYNIPAEDIILVKDGLIDSLSPLNGLPISKIAGLDFFVSNICAAMEADNVLLKKKGPLGVFSLDSKPDLAGLKPMQIEDKKELQSDLRQYGMTLGQLQYVISRQPLKWNAMSFNLRDLMTKETVRQGIDGICDRFGYPAELMSGKNATYENRSSAEKFLYQNNIIPFSLRRMARYNTFFGLDTQKLYLNYNHLYVLQEDVQKSGEASYALSQGLDIDFKDCIITVNEYRKAKEQDPIEGGDVYYPEWVASHGIKLNPTPSDGNAPKDTGTKK